MNKWIIIRHCAAALCIAVGVFLFTIQTDQEFMDIIPSDDPVYILPMKAGTPYTQIFLMRRNNISRLGIYMRPLQKAIDLHSTVTVQLMRGSMPIASGDIPALFIENGGPAYVRFSDAVPTVRNEQLSIVVKAPDKLSGSIGLRQSKPGTMAYNAFERIHPPLVQQFGGMLVAFGVTFLAWQHMKRHPGSSSIAVLIFLTILAAIPAINSSISYASFFLLALVVSISTWCVLRLSGRSTVASLYGASLVTYSSWLPLHIITRGAIRETLSIRDALIDPNQIAISHANGGYIGVLGALASMAGIGIWIWLLTSSRRKKFGVDTLVFGIGVASLLLGYIPVAIAACAWFASLAFDGLHQFLGKRDNLGIIVLVLLIIISILDLMHVGARTILYGSGI